MDDLPNKELVDYNQTINRAIVRNPVMVDNRSNFYRRYMEFRNIRSKLLPFPDHNNGLWTIVLHIYDSEIKGEILYVSNIGELSGVPQTTVIRHLSTLTEIDIVWRIKHYRDKRMVRVRLCPNFKSQLDDLFSAVS